MSILIGVLMYVVCFVPALMIQIRLVRIFVKMVDNCNETNESIWETFNEDGIGRFMCFVYPIFIPSIIVLISLVWVYPLCSGFKNIPNIFKLSNKVIDPLFKLLDKILP